MKDWKKIAVIGAGAWGTALAIKLASLVDKEDPLILWAFEPETVEDINQKSENKVFLPEVKLPSSIRATNSFSDLGDAGLIFLVCPVQATRALSQKFAPLISPDAPIVICSKGIEVKTGKLVSQILAEQVKNPLAVMSGPSFAKETALGKATALTLAAETKELAKALADFCSQNSFRLEPSTDRIGVQLAGAIKNVLAIASGLLAGANEGENARAALITQGLKESAKLIEAMGGKKETLLELAGIGDTLLTCTSQTSRNTSLGFALGKGESLEAILAKRRSVNEGLWTAESLIHLATHYQLDFPICLTIRDLLQGKTTAKEACLRLLEKNT